MGLRHSPTLASARRAALAAALVVGLSGCVTRELAHAPATPDKPWSVPGDSKYTRALREASQAPTGSDAAAQNGASFEPGRAYDLPELIDIAERHHPETREAWEQARQAALAIGLAEHTYLPQISANVVAGFQHTPLPIPRTLVPAGYFTADSRELIPLLAANWLLFDFGRREAQVREAKEKSFVANVAFTGAHQKVIYAVCRDYFALGAARAHRRDAETATKNAQLAQDTSESRQTHGLATVVEVAQARRQTAQARFNVVRALGAERTAYSALVASMGVEPNIPIGVADQPDLPLPAAPMQNVRALLEEALVQRPDVVAALGKVRAAEANLRSEQATYWPQIAVSAQIYQNVGGISTEGSPYYTVNNPGANALLSLDWPLFDAGARAARVAIARSQISAARAGRDGARDSAIADVTTAYDQLQTSFAEYQAAVIVEGAAATTLDAAIDSYRSGVGVLNDVITAENALSEAEWEKANARSNVFTSAAALAFATGAITSRR